MTLGGWILMSISVGAVVCLFFWCIYRVLFHKPHPPPEHLHGFDIATKDIEDEKD